MSKPDPVEKIVRSALAIRGYDFQEPSPDNLDFHVPELGVSIECKQFYTPRIAGQMQRTENVIAIQGMDAARAFAQMLNGERPDDIPTPMHNPEGERDE